MVLYKASSKHADGTQFVVDKSGTQICATYLMDKTTRAREFQLLDRVIRTVPIRKLVPHSDPARISQLCQTIIEDFAAFQPGEQALRAEQQAFHV